MAVFDATVLLPVLWSEVPPPTDPATGQPVIFFRERINQLIQNLQKRRTRVIIPTPALSEILVRAGPAAADYLDQLTASNAFRIEPFDERTAAEVAVMTSNALSEGDKRGRGEGLWSKIKYDRQIVAIAGVVGAATIYSEDSNIHTYGSEAGLNVVRSADLPIPESSRQGEFDLNEAEGEPDASEEDETADVATGEIQGDSSPTGVQSERSGVREDAEKAGTNEAPAEDDEAGEDEGPEEEVKPE